MINTKKWLLSFTAIVLTIVIFLCAAAYIIDPGFQFRVKDNTYFLSSRYVAPGLVKNQEYDTIILGSSMIQNFDVSHFEKLFNAEVLKVGVSGMNAAETIDYIKLAYDSNKASNFFICIDLSSFRTLENSKNEKYMFKNDPISNLRYMISYKTWLRYLPIGICTSVLSKTDKIPPSLSKKTNIDLLDDWSDDHTCSRETVVKNHLNNAYNVSEVDLNNLELNLKNTIKVFFENIDAEKGNHFFFFPPYSALFWCTAQENGYFDTYIRAKEYFYDLAAKNNCTVYDFQSAELITDLDNYRDTTHYGKHINTWMAEQMHDGKYIITKNNQKTISNDLKKLISSFKTENTDIFSSKQ